MLWVMCSDHRCYFCTKECLVIYLFFCFILLFTSHRVDVLEGNACPFHWIVYFTPLGNTIQPPRLSISQSNRASMLCAGPKSPIHEGPTPQPTGSAAHTHSLRGQNHPGGKRGTYTILGLMFCV